LTRYDKYLWYVLRHRWFVFIECCKLGIPWQGLIHDLSKFRPSEFFPYSRHFHGAGAKEWRDKTGYYKPTDTGDAAFDFAWFLHQKRNAHHWQYWIFPSGPSKDKVLQMPEKYIREMVADWRGAGRAQHRPDTVAWWTANKDKMVTTNYTRRYVEYLLGLTWVEEKHIAD
jgi:hypothetical protein